MIVGVGIDMVELERIGRAMERWPRFLDRILTPREKEGVGGPFGQGGCPMGGQGSSF